MNRLQKMAHAAVYGTKGSVVDRAKRPIARHTPFSPQAIRTVAGAVFLALSLRRVVRVVRAGLR